MWVRGKEEAAAAPPPTTGDVFIILTKTAERFRLQEQVNCYFCTTETILRFLVHA